MTAVICVFCNCGIIIGILNKYVDHAMLRNIIAVCFEEIKSKNVRGFPFNRQNL